MLENRWRSIDLGALAARTLDPYAAERPEAIKIDGPPVELDPRRALPLSLTLHELATNSVKYGALSAGGGQVRLSWRVIEENAGERAVLSWVERGGPVVEPPTGAGGFGTKLIERVFACELHGDAKLEYRPEGMRAEAWFPLT